MVENVAAYFFYHLDIYGREKDVVPTVFVDERFSDLWPTLCNRSCWWHSPSLPFNLDMIEFLLPLFFYYENVCRSRSHSLPTTNPYDPFHYYSKMYMPLFLLVNDPLINIFLSLSLSLKPRFRNGEEDGSSWNIPASCPASIFWNITRIELVEN